MRGHWPSRVGCVERFQRRLPAMMSTSGSSTLSVRARAWISCSSKTSSPSSATRSWDARMISSRRRRANSMELLVWPSDCSFSKAACKPLDSRQVALESRLQAWRTVLVKSCSPGCPVPEYRRSTHRFLRIQQSANALLLCVGRAPSGSSSDGGVLEAIRRSPRCRLAMIGKSFSIRSSVNASSGCKLDCEATSSDSASCGVHSILETGRPGVGIELELGALQDRDIDSTDVGPQRLSSSRRVSSVRSINSKRSRIGSSSLTQM